MAAEFGIAACYRFGVAWPAMGSPSDDLILEREISIPPAEYKRALALAFPGQVRDAGDCLRVDAGGTALEIKLTSGPPRVIASIRLPTLYVSMRFSGGGRELQQRVLAQMDLAMHRGGG
jgi:hypothetical protein